MGMFVNTPRFGITPFYGTGLEAIQAILKYAPVAHDPAEQYRRHEENRFSSYKQAFV